MKIKNLSYHDLFLVLFVIGTIGYFLSTLIIIPFLEPDPMVETFPNSCAQPSICTRVADTNNRADNIEPPVLHANFSQVKRAVKDFIGPQTILNETSDFMHIKWTMPVSRLLDDVFIKLLPGLEANTTIVWIQSQSRLGQSDNGSNTNRVLALIDFLTNYNFSK
jgi:uncharacterized protein (DUF1499 family)